MSAVWEIFSGIQNERVLLSIVCPKSRLLAQPGRLSHEPVKELSQTESPGGSAVIITSACCRHTLAIYRGPTHEGAILRCLWCTQAMMVRNGVWENEEDACATPGECPPLKAPEAKT